jgi:hypothetical protein
MKDRKNKIKEQVIELVEMSKNLPTPTTKQQQKVLDNIQKEILELSNYIDDIGKNNNRRNK